MRSLTIAALMIALLPVSAYAEEQHGPATVRTDKEKKEDDAIDKAYRERMKYLGAGGQAVKTDPWQSVRPAGGDSTKR